MRKSFLFTIAGAGLILAGCQDNFIGEHRFETLPVDEFPAETEPVRKAAPPAARRVQPPAPVQELPVQPKVSKPKYEPMTGVISSGGVDSDAPKSKKKDKATGQANAEGGIHVVRRGEFPERIARKYGIKLADLMKANNLTEESAKKLHVGQKLVIPGKSTASNSSSAPAADKKAVGGEVSNGKYAIRSGDTPERIARKFNVKLSELMAANNLTEASARKLQIGQQLIIPGKSVSAPPAADSASSGQKPADSSSTANTAAAETAATTTATDDLANFEIIELQADTTYAELAQKYNIAEAELRKINIADPNQTKLPKGEAIFVPKR